MSSQHTCKFWHVKLFCFIVSFICLIIIGKRICIHRAREVVCMVHVKYWRNLTTATAMHLHSRFKSITFINLFFIAKTVSLHLVKPVPVVWHQKMFASRWAEANVLVPRQPLSQVVGVATCFGTFFRHFDFVVFGTVFVVFGTVFVFFGTAARLVPGVMFLGGLPGVCVFPFRHYIFPFRHYFFPFRHYCIYWIYY